MALPAGLEKAYENADYVVFCEPELVLKIGEPSPRLDAMLEQIPSAAFVTACNPGSEPRSDAQNRAAMEALEGLVRAAGCPHHPGEGRDPDGKWPAEPSLLVVGIYRENAEALGRLFGQNAIVFIVKGEAPRLIFL